jgi:hypothetical protein
VTTPKALPAPKKRARNGAKGAKKAPRGLPFAKGDDPRRGDQHAAGKMGGRPTNDFVLRMQGLALTPVPEEILRDIDAAVAMGLLQRHPQVWMQLERLRLEAWREVCDRGHGRPITPIALDTDATRRQVLKSLTFEELLANIKTIDEEDALDDSRSQADN